MKTKSKFYFPKLILPFIIALVYMAQPVEVFCFYQVDSLKTANENPIKEVNLLPAGKYMLVKTRLNDKKAYFLVDTGASCSVLNTKSAKYFGFAISGKRGKNTGGTTSFGRSTQSTPVAINAILEIGPHKINRAYLAKDLSSIKGFISRKTALQIAGILGTDMLRILGARLDLQQHVLTF